MTINVDIGDGGTVVLGASSDRDGIYMDFYDDENILEGVHNLSLEQAAQLMTALDIFVTALEAAAETGDYDVVRGGNDGRT